MAKEKILITTHTGEPSQPVRIYFKVINPKTVIGVFKKLRCVYFEQALNRWRWTYEHEAKKLRFETSYSKIPKEAKPIVMGDFFWRGDQELLLEVRSFDRAIKAIEFFEKRINPRAAYTTKIRIVNRFFDADEPNIAQLLEAPYDNFFDENEIVIPDPSRFLKKIEEETSESELTSGEIHEAQLDYLETQFKEKSPEIEEIPFDFYRENELGLNGLEMALTLRRFEASQHFEGNESFSQYDLLEQMTESFMDIIESEEGSQIQETEEEE